MFQAVFIGVLSVAFAFGFIFLSSAEPASDQSDDTRVFETPEEFLQG